MLQYSQSRPIPLPVLQGGTGNTTGTATINANLTGPVTSSGNATTIGTNQVSAANLATNAITLGYAQVTSNQTTTSTSAAAISGLSINVTVPAGGRDVEITVFGRDAYMAAVIGLVYIFSGATSGALTTQLAATQINTATGTSVPCICMAHLVAPSAGAIYYTAAFSTTNAADAITIEAGAGYPLFIRADVK